jgi:hypothetical protein
MMRFGILGSLLATALLAAPAVLAQSPDAFERAVTARRLSSTGPAQYADAFERAAARAGAVLTDAHDRGSAAVSVALGSAAPQDAFERAVAARAAVDKPAAAPSTDAFVRGVESLRSVRAAVSSLPQTARIESAARVPSATAIRNSFHWSDFVLGAGAGIGLALLLVGVGAGVMSRRGTGRVSSA